MVSAMSPAESRTASELLVRQLETRLNWEAARSILLFHPLPDEPDIRPLVERAIAHGCAVALPAFDPSTGRYEARVISGFGPSLACGLHGIPEPGPLCPLIALNRLDLVLVPGVAFDARGGRLGRGKGFYDRLLAAVNGMKCGVAFDEQIVDAVPVGPQDIRVNCILTPTRWIPTRRSSRPLCVSGMCRASVRLVIVQCGVASPRRGPLSPL